MKQFNLFSWLDVRTTLALTVGSPSAHRRGTMLKHVAFLLLFLFAGFGQMWGTDPSVTISVSSDTWTNAGTANTGSAVSVTKGGITVSSTKGYKDGTNHIREYQNSVITISSTVGNIKSIAFTCTAQNNNDKGPGKLAKNSSGNAGTYEYSGYVGTWSFGAGTSNVSSVQLKATAQCRWTQVEVTYVSSGCSTKPTVGANLTSVSATTNSITATVPISAIGGCNITENGLVYSTSVATPTVGTANCYTATTTACGSAAANKTVTIDNLACGTTYYVRGYATNGAGTQYTTNTKTQATSDCLVDYFIDDIQSTTGYAGEGMAKSGDYSGSLPTIADKTVATTGNCQALHYHFCGWVTEEFKDNPNGHLATINGTATGETYYAVWAKQAAGSGSASGGITQAEITTAADGKTAGSYGSQTSSSASGNWTGSYAFNTKNNKKVIQITNSGSRNVISPVFGGNITSISVVYTVDASSNRTLTFKDGETSLGTITASANQTEKTSSSLSVTGSHTSFTLTTSAGAVYFHSISVTYNNVVYTDSISVCCDELAQINGSVFVSHTILKCNLVIYNTSKVIFADRQSLKT